MTTRLNLQAKDLVFTRPIVYFKWINFPWNLYSCFSWTVFRHLRVIICYYLLVHALTMLEQEVNLCWDEATPFPFLFLYSCSRLKKMHSQKPKQYWRPAEDPTCLKTTFICPVGTGTLAGPMWGMVYCGRACLLLLLDIFNPRRPRSENFLSLSRKTYQPCPT